ncbi:hypothetical protein LEN26_000963 [Aphanomyces euteiches]|nr:hypothetical protein AeMF1_021408 [Aphanomyces euteiches]KAH9123782.1 hypothetical protein LEN26_009826 [Aphanomyces euteiches]KAH9162386.1 hypothetical protein LEN26_000963 [Aphanomyces euteiches]KAH9192973.1 hypothetical protein AeNC1_005045 [Aphanomyces euteiches]
MDSPLIVQSSGFNVPRHPYDTDSPVMWSYCAYEGHRLQDDTYHDKTPIVQVGWCHFPFCIPTTTTTMKFLSLVASAFASVALASPQVTLVEMPTTTVTVVGLFPNETNANASLVGLFEKQSDGTLKLKSVYQKTTVSSTTVESLETAVNTPLTAIPSIRP